MSGTRLCNGVSVPLRPRIQCVMVSFCKTRTYQTGRCAFGRVWFHRLRLLSNAAVALSHCVDHSRNEDAKYGYIQCSHGIVPLSGTGTKRSPATRPGNGQPATAIDPGSE